MHYTKHVRYNIYVFGMMFYSSGSVDSVCDSGSGCGRGCGRGRGCGCGCVDGSRGPIGPVPGFGSGCVDGSRGPIGPVPGLGSGCVDGSRGPIGGCPLAEAALEVLQLRLAAKCVANKSKTMTQSAFANLIFIL